MSQKFSISKEVLRKLDNLEREREIRRLPKFYSIHDMILMLQCDEKTIRNLVENGSIHYFKVGRLLRFAPQDVDTFIRHFSTRREINVDFEESFRLEKEDLRG